MMIGADVLETFEDVSVANCIKEKKINFVYRSNKIACCRRLSAYQYSVKANLESLMAFFVVIKNYICCIFERSIYTYFIGELTDCYGVTDLGEFSLKSAKIDQKCGNLVHHPGQDVHSANLHFVINN
jgi:hypothetical protein